MKRLAVWLWAIPVLVSSLVFWPIWLAILVGLVIKLTVAILGIEPHRTGGRRVKFTAKIRNLPREYGEGLVGVIDSQKYNLLALSLVGTIMFLGFVGFALFVAPASDHLTKSVEDIGGYVAIAGLVVGLPALAYAMVTDSAVHRIETFIGVSEEDVKFSEAGLKEALAGFREYLGDEHFVQVFVPGRFRIRVVPLYDPDHKGPRDGWSIDSSTPQAITGSAWVGARYLCGLGEDELRHPKLRLAEKQLQEYRDLTAVAAAPILDEDNHVITADDREVPEILGVLTVCSTSVSTLIKKHGEYRERHELEASALVPILRHYVAQKGALTPEDLARQH